MENNSSKTLGAASSRTKRFLLGTTILPALVAFAAKKAITHPIAATRALINRYRHDRQDGFIGVIMLQDKDFEKIPHLNKNLGLLNSNDIPFTVGMCVGTAASIGTVAGATVFGSMAAREIIQIVYHHAL